MGVSCRVHIVIAMSKTADAEKVKGILMARGYEVDGVFQSGSRALQMAYDLSGGIVISGYRCTDMMYEELSNGLPDYFSLLLIASPSVVYEAPPDIASLALPFSVAQLLSSVDMIFEQLKRRGRDKKGARVRTQLDTAIIDMAKQDIMKKYDMTEPEAYNYLRRQSMDRKMTMEEFAKESLSLTRPHSSKPVQRKWRTKNV